ncbi:MAG: GlxA family transcriptional regulator [Labilithrix sp.]|nr:GlxA family transcriptional regulator [Labilithrix sp.]MBX3217396.1 GlxA family transcriptional regulator [Labilithrix sp.]
MQRKTTRRRIGVLAFDGVTALDLVGPADAFAAAVFESAKAEPSEVPAYEVLTVGLTGRRCVAESGVVIQPSYTVKDVPPLDTLVIPGGHGLREPKVNRAVATWVGSVSQSVRRVVSVCTGIYGLAPTGLLDGRRATTHWRFVDDVAARFPKLRLDPDALFVDDGKFYTSAGVTAGIDLSLSLIEEDLGATAALRVARELVVYVRRSGGQAQFSEPLRFQCGAPDRYADLTAYVAAHLDGDLSIEALARRMAVSPRQLNRQCHDRLGCSPAVLVQRIRLDEARSRLLPRAVTVEQVAASVGYHSADAFRRAFEQRFGINPSAYRSRFATRRSTSRGGRQRP